MTIRTTAKIEVTSTITCDICGQTVRGTATGRNAATQARDIARHMARGMGWLKAGESDLCRLCATMQQTKQQAIEDKTNAHFHGRD